MRVRTLLALGACGLLACSTDVSSSSNTGDDELNAGSEDATTPACSLTYWKWILDELEPRFAQPVSAVSDASMTELVARHPAAGETDATYGVCWSVMFSKHFFAPAAKAFHDANVTFLDASSGARGDYARYVSGITMTPELRRNARALLALRPRTMDPVDMGTWTTAYETILAETIRPVGFPGPLQYEGVVEPEWTVTPQEAEYLTVLEGARAEPSSDSVYAEWLPTFEGWVFGPPPPMSRSFVFNVPWEPAASGDSYGLSGLRTEGETVVLPPPVRAFVDRLASTAPSAVGEQDSAKWLIVYHGRALRALSDLRQHQPLLDASNALALDLLERIKPAQLRGLFAYREWLDLLVLASAESNDGWSRRFLPLEPCVDAGDLTTAQAAFADPGARDAAKLIGHEPRICSK